MRITSDQYRNELEVVPHHKMGIKILDSAQLKNLFPDCESLLRRIEEHRKQITILGERKYKIDSQYNLMYDNVFSIMGKRGAGKTSVVLTLKQILQSSSNADIILPIVMPEMIPAECSMIGWILSLLKESVKELEKTLNHTDSNMELNFSGCLRTNNESLEREYERVKELCYSQFYQVEATESFSAAIINTEQQTQNSFNFSNELVKFWDKLVESIKQTKDIKNEEPLIYIIFDDVDLIPDAVLSLLSTIIKYLSHPNLIVLVTADEDLLYDVIEYSMNKRLGKYEELKTYGVVSEAIRRFIDSDSDFDFAFYQSNKEKVFQHMNQKLETMCEIPKLYGDKVLPPSCRYYLKTFGNVIEKSRFIERVEYDDSNKTEINITLEQFVKNEILRYIRQTNQSNSNNFVVSNDRFVRAYFVFWGETSRQLANETIILHEFITHIIMNHQELENSRCTEEEYYEKLYFIMIQFANSTLNAIGNLGMTTREVSELIDELLVYRPERWGIFLNYSYLSELMEILIRNYSSTKASEGIKQLIRLTVFMFFLENILIMEKNSLPSLKAGQRNRIHGKGILVDILDYITTRNYSLICKSQGRDLKEFLLFYEGIVNDPEILVNFDLTNVRCVRNYLQTLPYKLIEEHLDLSRYVRENPKWFKTIVQILYLSYEGVYDIHKPQILLQKLNTYSSEINDVYYEQKLIKLRDGVIDVLSSLYLYDSNMESEQLDDLELEPDDIFNPGDKWKDSYEHITDLKYLEKELISDYKIDDSKLRRLACIRKSGTEQLLEKAESVCEKLIELYELFNKYTVRDEDKYSRLADDIYEMFNLKMIELGEDGTLNRNEIDNLFNKIVSEISKMKNKSEYGWNFSYQSDVRNAESLYMQLCDTICLHLSGTEGQTRGKEIIKLNAIFAVLQKYYLVSWIRDKQQQGDFRIDRQILPYKKLYTIIRQNLKGNETRFVNRMLKEYVREACDKYIETIW